MSQFNKTGFVCPRPHDYYDHLDACLVGLEHLHNLRRISDGFNREEFHYCTEIDIIRDIIDTFRRDTCDYFCLDLSKELRQELYNRVIEYEDDPEYSGDEDEGSNISCKNAYRDVIEILDRMYVYYSRILYNEGKIAR